MQFVLLLLLVSVFLLSSASEVVIVNHHDRKSATLTAPQRLNVASSGDAKVIRGPSDVLKFGEMVLEFELGYEKNTTPVPAGRFAVVVFNRQEQNAVSAALFGDRSWEIDVWDTNDLQLELSAQMHHCITANGRPSSDPMPCVAKAAFGGLPLQFVRESFGNLWQDLNYWRICNQVSPAATIETRLSKSGHTVEILRQRPLVATVRKFVSEGDCAKLMTSVNRDQLVSARVGGEGATETSEFRETLTDNMFVNWDERDAVSKTAARTFDLASELLGKQIPYEGQEPINFLHYLKGFEYKGVCYSTARSLT